MNMMRAWKLSLPGNFNPSMFTAAESSLTILMITCRQKDNKENI